MNSLNPFLSVFGQSTKIDCEIYNTVQTCGKYLVNLLILVVLSHCFYSGEQARAQEKTLFQPWADIRAFGAVGNGEHDDTAAFEEALKTKLPVFIPKPKIFFLISRTLYVSSGQTVMGLGKGVSIIKYSGKGSCFMSNPTYKRKHQNILFRDFTILGNGKDKADGIFLIRANNSSIENVHIKDIGGTGIIIDGKKARSVSQAHYSFLQNIEITGKHKIGIQLRGWGKGEGSNRHRLVFVRVNGSSEVALDIWRQSSTSTIFGFAVENVNNGIRIAGRHNYFYGLNIEKVKANAIEFLKGAQNNRFYGITMSKVSGKEWVNPNLNELRKGEYPFLK